MRCSYCHDGLPTVWVCPRCRSILHRDCLTELEECPSLGCGAPLPTADCDHRPLRRVARSAAIGLLWVCAAATLAAASALVHEHQRPEPPPPAPVALNDYVVSLSDLVDRGRSAALVAAYAQETCDADNGRKAAQQTADYFARAAMWTAAHERSGHAGEACLQCRVLAESTRKLVEAWARRNAPPEGGWRQGLRIR